MDATAAFFQSAVDPSAAAEAYRLISPYTPGTPRSPAPVRSSSCFECPDVTLFTPPHPDTQTRQQIASPLSTQHQLFFPLDRPPLKKARNKSVPAFSLLYMPPISGAARRGEGAGACRPPGTRWSAGWRRWRPHSPSGAGHLGGIDVPAEIMSYRSHYRRRSRSPPCRPSHSPAPRSRRCRHLWQSGL